MSDGWQFPAVNLSLGRTYERLGLDLDLEPGMSFTVEPGIYFDRFGVRTELNMYVGPDEATVTGPMQAQVVPLLS